MSRSFEDINYSLRPNKCVERKMLCETFRRLTHFAPLSAYRYIGFGSTYFSDFVLFHRELNLIDMKSIEKEEELAPRFNFNQPYQCVSIIYGESAAILSDPSKLNLSEKPSIVWLDYDGPLEADVLADIKTLVTNLQSGSIFLASVNAEPGPESGDRMGTLESRIRKDRIPMGIEKKHLTPSNFGNVLHQVISNEIEETLSARNCGVQEHEKLVYNQLFNLRYKDNALMATVGGILTANTPEESEKLRLCAFEVLPFVSITITGEAYKIEVPNLTWREIRELDKQLPHHETPVLKGVPEKDIKKYAKIYRYFPAFAETSF